MDLTQIDTALKESGDTAKNQSEDARHVNESPTRTARLKELSRPKRSGFLHWLAFAFALISLGIIMAWVFSDRTTISAIWGYVDIFISVFFAMGAIEVFVGLQRFQIDRDLCPFSKFTQIMQKSR